MKVWFFYFEPKWVYPLFIVQDMASFKIAALQKALEESVPQADLDKVNKEYHQLTEKYRDLLEKGNTLVSKAEAITGLEVHLFFSNQYIDLYEDFFQPSYANSLKLVWLWSPFSFITLWNYLFMA